LKKLENIKKMSKIKIPPRMRWLFWSYDIKSLDLERDKDYIITQVLNYGTWDEVKWLFKIYSESEIKKVVKNPSRGVWFEKVLNFWATIFNIHFNKNVWQKAVFNINPH